MRCLIAGLGAASALAVAAPAHAQTMAAVLAGKAEAVEMKQRRVQGLLGYGFDIAEYAGETSSRSFSLRALGDGVSRDIAKTDFKLQGGGIQPALSASCRGGQSLTRLLWITWDRDNLAYTCTFSRDGAPAGEASFELALQKAGVMARLSQPQRAGEVTLNGRTLRFQTQRIGGMSLPTGRVAAYVISRGDEPIGGVDFNRLGTPRVYLPPKGSPDRDAAALAAAALITFVDPANANPG